MNLIQHDLQLTWQRVLDQLKTHLTQPSFETWIAPLSLIDVQPDLIVLETTSAFNRDWIKKHYAHLIAQAVAEVNGNGQVPQVDIRESERPESASTASLSSLLQSAHADTPSVPDSTSALNTTGIAPVQLNPILNPKYTFEQFVVGSHNRFCHAAALAVAESPSMSYNPLFLYGGVGLGKTHLMQAIGHHIYQHHPELKVTYVTTEQFTNDLITALGKQDMNQFRNRYRKIDILLIDDIQFLEGKDRTQEEIFHTFNTLHEAGKQIVISSDRPPERLSRLEDRLRSRFSWGLIADIQPADFETRVAIVQRKSLQLNLPLTDDVMAFVAECFPTNIRELEGALNKLSAYRMLTDANVDLSQAQALLGKRFDPNRISKDDLIEVVARYYHLQRADLQSNLRTKHIAFARQVAIYIIRELTDDSFPQIGLLFGGRRHTTMLYAYEKMKDLVKTNQAVKQQVQELMDQIKQKMS